MQVTVRLSDTLASHVDAVRHDSEAGSTFDSGHIVA